MSLEGIVGRPYGHTNVSVAHVSSSVSGTIVFLGIGTSNFKVEGVTGESVIFKCPQIDICPAGRVIHFIEWNAAGEVTFERTPSSTNTVNGGVSVTYSEDDFNHPVLFVVLTFANSWRIWATSGANTGVLEGVAPNIQIVDGTVDAGHGAGDGSLYFAPTVGEGYPILPGPDGAIVLADAEFTTIEQGAVVISPHSSGDVGEGSVLVGNTSGSVGSGSVMVGEHEGGNMGDGARVVGGVIGNVGAGACVLGTANGDVPITAILLGTGAPSATIGRINIVGTESEVANTQASGDGYTFIPLNHNGHTRYIPLVASPVICLQGTAGKLIVAGSGAVGGPSGQAYTKLNGATNYSTVIGFNACDSWNAASTTTGQNIFMGANVLKNLSATSDSSNNVVVGGVAMEGRTTPYSGNVGNNVVMGVEAAREYQTFQENVLIGYRNSRDKITNASDLECVRIGSRCMRAAPTGGRGVVALGYAIMDSATHTFTENNGGIFIGKLVGNTMSGTLGIQNVLIGLSVCTATAVTSSGQNNTVVGGGNLSGATSTMTSRNTLVGGGILTAAGGGVGSNTTVVGATSFAANVAQLANNLTCVGAAQTGVPAAGEVMIGNACAASTVAGRLSLGNAMEAVAGAANAGAAVLPLTPQAFMPINYNGVAYKIPLYLP